MQYVSGVYERRGKTVQRGNFAVQMLKQIRKIIFFRVFILCFKIGKFSCLTKKIVKSNVNKNSKIDFKKWFYLLCDITCETQMGPGPDYSVFLNGL